MTSIEFLIILSVAMFHFSVVSRRKGLDLLMPDTEFGQCFLKECQRLFLAVSHHCNTYRAAFPYKRYTDVCRPGAEGRFSDER